LESFKDVQVDENAKIWKEVNKIREEKATDTTILKNVVEAVSGLKTQFTEGFMKLEKDIMELKMMPAKRWESLVSDLIRTIVALGVGGLVTYLTIKGGP
jgi:phosphopantetheine adenylyltransferase